MFFFFRNGFADKLRRLIQSNHSSISMWNHQVSLLELSSKQPCSYKSSNNCFARSSSLVNQNNNLFQEDSSLKCSEDIFDILGAREEVCDNELEVYKLSKSDVKPSCVRRLTNSLEIRSPSSTSTPSRCSPKRSFILPENHLCVEILQICWNTPVSLCVHCSYLSAPCCFRNNAPVKVDPTVLVFLDLKDAQSNLLTVGTRIKIFVPWYELII